MTFKLRQIFLWLVSVLLLSGACRLESQVVPSALRSPVTLTVGATASAFDPDYVPNKLVGVGAYADLNIFRLFGDGFGVEAEGRWQRFREVEQIHQDNYLIGPRVQLHPIWRAKPYVKVLGGYSNMNFEYGYATGRFTTFAAGGGVDLKLTRRISVRAVDFEYQYWPTFLGSSLTPYGVSAGVGYRIF